jgi:hypothetical protein
VKTQWNNKKKLLRLEVGLQPTHQSLACLQLFFILVINHAEERASKWLTQYLLSPANENMDALSILWLCTSISACVWFWIWIAKLINSYNYFISILPFRRKSKSRIW